MIQKAEQRVLPPLAFKARFWPHVTFYDKQLEIIQSVVDNDETYVPAGNMLGKDFVAGFLALWHFFAHRESRVVTTSVSDDHLNVLWGEIGRFLDTSVVPLKSTEGGPLVVNHQMIRKIISGEVNRYQYLKGKVSAKGESMQGHHAERTLFILDEASGIEDIAFTMGNSWSGGRGGRKLILGNPHPCNNFFYYGVKGSDVRRDSGVGYYRKVIKIRAQDSPNVRLGEAQVAAGIVPTDDILIPGVISYEGYLKGRKFLDKVMQCIGLDGEFYAGPGNLLYPPVWLNRAEQLASQGVLGAPRAMGVDSAEGGDNTSWAVTSTFGLKYLKSMKTPDTSVIPSITLALMHEYGLKPGQVFFDLGGGGKEHVDRLRRQGHDVRGVAFNESATAEKRRGMTQLEERKRQDETKYVYKNRKAEMYGILRSLLDPANEYQFGLPESIIGQKRDDGGPSLREQLAVIPYDLDDGGRMYVRPKTKKKNTTSTEQSLIEIVGCSPDEADSLVLAVFGMSGRAVRPKVGVAF